jgi:hypothetical protein
MFFDFVTIPRLAFSECFFFLMVLPDVDWDSDWRIEE